MGRPWDTIVIGAGHNGLVAAIELGRADQSVLVLEAGATVGGSATTIEPLLPRYRHSPHANCFLFADLMPRSIAPTTLGVELLQPQAQLGVAFSDGRPPTILHRPDALDRTLANLSNYSGADARAYCNLKRRSAALGPMIAKGLYSAPSRDWFDAQAGAVKRALGSLCPKRLGEYSARTLIDRLFVTPEIRLLLYLLALETGVPLDDVGSDVAFLGYSLWIAGRWRIPAGGMFSYSNALLQAALDLGVKVQTSTPVARILVANGKAVGVETAQGEHLVASTGIVAAISLLSVYDRLSPVGPTPSEATELESFRRAGPSSIGTSVFCLERAPSYTSARHDPQINKCLKVAIGYDCPADLLAQISDVQTGRLPRPGGVVRVHSLLDPTLAPTPHHVAGVDSSFPSEGMLNDDMWDMIKQSFPSALDGCWRTYLDEQPVTLASAMSFDHGESFERRLLLRFGAEQYRSNVPGLYLGGPGVYPGGGVHGACGANAARTLLTDNVHWSGEAST